MKKIFIGLLVAAAGAGVYFLLLQKKDHPVANGIHKEWIVGKWKTNAVMNSDSNFSKYRFDFQKDGNIVRSLNDSVKADSSRYEWNKANELVWKEKAADSTGKVYTVLQLTTDSLQLRASDSSTVLFTKVK